MPSYEHVASVTYKAPYDGIGKAYNALLRWIESNGYMFMDQPRNLLQRASQGQAGRPGDRGAGADGEE